nr:metallopeptidase TldD-related protein [Acidobacteriota bacterium]
AQQSAPRPVRKPVVSSPAVPNSAVPGDDPVLTALRQELKRSQERLQLTGQKKPYFIQYIVNDTDAYDYESSFGAPLGHARNHTRLLTVFVRVGDYAQDNDLGYGLGELDLLSTEDDVLAMRHTLWLATDRAYKNALQMLTAKQTALKQYESTDDVPSFSREAPVQYFEPRVALPADTATFERALDDATGLYRTDPLIQRLGGSLHLSVNNYYVVNSEGTAVRMAQPSHAVTVGAETQAPDGMRLRRMFSRQAVALETLPSAAELKRKVEEQLQTLKALRAAPAVAGEYRGPVLFSNDAGGTLLNYLLATNLVGNRPPLGKSGRVTGPYGESFRARILPDTVTVIDDPTVATYAGQPLVAATIYDDEGVKARPVTLVEKGVLQSYLVSRRPIRDFITSNGHGRNLGPAVNASPSNIILKSSKAEPAAGLKQKLIALCKERGLEYGYYVGTMAGVETPRLLYRVYVKDGREELVRGAVLDELDTRALRNDLIGVGDDPYVSNDPANIPVSYVAPSLLFGEIVVKATPEAKDKLPQYSPPAL